MNVPYSIRSKWTASIVLLVCLLAAGVVAGCTINIYHAPAAVSDSVVSKPVVVSSATGISDTEAAVFPQPITAAPDTLLSMSAMGSDGGKIIRHMDSIVLNIQSNVDAYLNCYYQQANGDIVKVFPNKYATSYWVQAGQQLKLPNPQQFEIIADKKGASESFLCLASSEDIMSKLQGIYRANSFQALPVSSYDSMYAVYDNATQANLIGRVVTYEVQ